MPNVLAHETSPYLLQHQDNPVAWRPWGAGALEEAKRENKPILLSIGYAACHWCHVMAHESFEDPEIAGLMNEHFVNIKVDREERPDLDAVYQNALALLGEQGGWPCSCSPTARPSGAAPISRPRRATAAPAFPTCCARWPRWNGLMIAALAHAGFVFDEPDWIAAARRAFATVQERLSLDGRLGHPWRQGRVQRHGMLDDYAAMSRAALALFEITGEAAYLQAAEGWVAAANAHHWDDDAGGYFMSADDAEDLVARPKTAIDAAAPSGNALMVQVLARLHLLTGEEDHARRAEATLAAFAPQVRDSFPHMTALLAGVEMLAQGTQVVVAGDADGRRPFLRAVAGKSLPNVVVVPTEGPDGPLPAGHPAHGKGPVDGKPAAYICARQPCQPPIIDPEALRRRLSAR